MHAATDNKLLVLSLLANGALLLALLRRRRRRCLAAGPSSSDVLICEPCDPDDWVNLCHQQPEEKEELANPVVVPCGCSCDLSSG